MRRILFSFFAVSVWSFAAISINTAWEVRPTVGASTNGGGYVQGATGTDMSQFNNKNAAACSSCQSATVNISTTDGVTAGTTTITSITGNYSSALIGNIVYISGGTGSVTANRYQVLTVSGATSFTVDRSTGLTAGTGVTINIGGALDKVSTAIGSTANPTAGNIIWVKATGTDAETASLTFPNNQTPANTAPFSQLVGYNTTRGDCDNLVTRCPSRPTIQATTNSGISLISGGNAGWNMRSIILDCNSLTTCSIVGAQTYYLNFYNVKAMNWTAAGYANGGGSNAVSITDSEFTGGVSGCTSVISINATYEVLARNWIHDNNCGASISSINVGNGAIIINNLLTNNTSDGITPNTNDDRGTYIINNTIYNSARHCINASAGELGLGSIVQGNIFVNCGQTSGAGWAFIGGVSAGWPAFPFWDGNFYYNNKSGNREFLDDTGSTNPVNAANGYTSAYDVLGSGSPFVNAGANNFALDPTTAAGRAAIGVAPAGVIGGNAAVVQGYMDFGAVHTQYGTGSASSASNSAYAQ